MFDGKAFGAEIVGVVKDYLERHLSPVVARLDAIERQISNMPAPKDGKDAAPDAVADIVSNRMAAEIDEIRALIDAIPHAPELPDIPAMVADAVAAVPVPQNGKDAPAPTLDQLREAVCPTEEFLQHPLKSVVREYFEKFPPAPGQPGKDGVGLAGAIIDRSGNLTLTLTDGTTRDLGLIVGKDGDPGRPGADGFGFDDMTVEHDGERAFTLKWTKGERTAEKTFTVPVQIYRGVFADGKGYERGDTVTWAGSLWHCDEPTDDKPENGGKGWTLAAKRGRDGKDGTLKAAPSGKVKI